MTTWARPSGLDERLPAFQVGNRAAHGSLHQRDALGRATRLEHRAAHLRRHAQGGQRVDESRPPQRERLRESGKSQ